MAISPNDESSPDRTPSPARLLLLIPTTSYRAADFLEAAARLGVEVTVGSDQTSVLSAFSEGGTLEVDFARPEQAVEQIAAHAERFPLRAIVGVDEGTATIAALASRRLGLRHNEPEAVAATGNKHRFRQVLSAAGVAQPAFKAISLDEEPETAARQINRYPIVLKPLALSASQGVLRVDEAGEFASAFERIRAILKNASESTGLRAEPYVLAEDYLPGGEVALEGLLIGGRLHVLALFDKPDTMEGPTFEETIFITPSRLPPETQELIRSRCEESIAALGLREGPVHAELRLTPDEGPVPLEIAARSIGGLCARTLKFGTGTSLEEIILQHALGRDPAELQREATPVGVMMLPVHRAGRLQAVEGQDAARAVPGVGEVTITVAPGTVIRPLPEGDRYLGFIFARGETPEAVEAALRRAAEHIDPRFDEA